MYYDPMYSSPYIGYLFILTMYFKLLRHYCTQIPVRFISDPQIQEKINQLLEPSQDQTNRFQLISQIDFIQV